MDIKKIESNFRSAFSLIKQISVDELDGSIDNSKFSVSILVDYCPLESLNNLFNCFDSSVHVYLDSILVNKLMFTIYIDK